MQFRNFVDEGSFLSEVKSFAQTCVKQYASQIDANENFPEDFVAKLAERRLFALEKLSDTCVPLEPQISCELMLKTIEALSFVCASTGKLVLDQNFGQVQMFQQYASEELSSFFIPKIQSGASQMALLMTEPHTGSNLADFKCVAKKVEGGFLIEGSKDWITGARDRTLYLLVARSSVEPHHFGLFFVDRSVEEANRTIRISPPKRQLGLRGLGECKVDFINTFVPESCVILPCHETTVTKVMEHYNLKRCGTSAIAIGLSKAALHCAYHYLRGRHPGSDGRLAFQNSEFNCARMYSLIQASQQLNKWAAEQVIAGDNTGVPSSAAKLFATESAIKVTNTAIQLCGANATSQEMPLERFMRDARMLTIAGGTSEVLQRTIGKNLPTLLHGSDFT